MTFPATAAELEGQELQLDVFIEFHGSWWQHAPLLVEGRLPHRSQCQETATSWTVPIVFDWCGLKAASHGEDAFRETTMYHGNPSFSRLFLQGPI